jgi:hypothetical protein
MNATSSSNRARQSTAPGPIPKHIADKDSRSTKEEIAVPDLVSNALDDVLRD